MKKLIAWLCVAGAALCVTSIAWAGSPTSQSVRKTGALVTISVGQTADLAAAAKDTVVIDIRDLAWIGSGTAATVYSNVNIVNQSTAGDSLSIIVDSSIDGTVWTADITAFVLDGQTAAEKVFTVPGRYARFRITNNDVDAHAYDVVMIAPRGR